MYHIAEGIVSCRISDASWSSPLFAELIVEADEVNAGLQDVSIILILLIEAAVNGLLGPETNLATILNLLQGLLARQSW